MESPFLHVPGLLRYTGLFLSGVCHQLPEHSLFVGGHQLPLCARCTGTYLGALWALLFFLWRGRSRSSWLPPLRIVAVLVLFFLFWAVDGTNSYVHYVTGSQILYAPSNWLRLASGMANGVTLSALLFPLFNFTLWQVPQQSQVIHDGTELAGLLLSLLALGWILQLNIAALSSALVFLSLAGVLIMLAMVNAMIALLLLRRENSARNWRQALPFVATGLVMTLAEVGGIALVRYWFFSSS
jgi:uncharacterized membrane protein